MSIVGQAKKEEFNPEEAKKMAARVAKKANPLLSKWRAKKLADKEENKQRRKRGLGL